MSQRSSLTEVKPRLVVKIERVVAAEEKVTGAETIQRGTLEVFVSLPYSYRLFHQQSRRNDIGTGDVIKDGVETGHAHAGLEHHKGTQRGQQAVCVDILIDEHDLVFQTLSVEYRHDGIHIGKEEIDTLLGHLARHKTRSRGQGWTARRVGDSIDSILDLRGKTGLSLGFAQLTDDLGS